MGGEKGGNTNNSKTFRGFCIFETSVKSKASFSKVESNIKKSTEVNKKLR